MHSVRTLMLLCRVALFMASCLVSLIPASAASLNSRLNEARELLANGAATESVDAYREILIEEPESGSALFGIACGLYRQAEAAEESGDAEEALIKYEEAKEAFNAIGYSQPNAIRESAAFNAANATASIAKIKYAAVQQNPDTMEEAQKALESAVLAYEVVLDDYPGNAKAQQNLDHMRYLLMGLLQQQEQQQDENQHYTFSIIQSAETDLPGRVVKVLPPDTPSSGEDGNPQSVPPAGNAAVIVPAEEVGP